ncbi:hypothetical protein [Streptomyces sp. NBC_01304]|uniref:hypothetical protein n=1 Tax=Streptomyces sp. NBC_01304 TaxID=2903818 RepID=UPI002E0F3210|nr:hypothetical protein OG430_34365 [Streptomyces sp. NBC_01304]
MSYQHDDLSVDELLLPITERKGPPPQDLRPEHFAVAQPRDLNLVIRGWKDDDSEEPLRYTYALLVPGKEALVADSVLGRQVRGGAGELRNTWDETAAGDLPASVYKPANGSPAKPFRLDTQVDLSQVEPSVISRIFQNLVFAGRAAFRTMFAPHFDHIRMGLLVKELVRLLRERECVMTIWSNQLAAPWALLCLPDAGDLARTRYDTTPEQWGARFWGYRHLIEHRGDEWCESVSAKIQVAQERPLAGAVVDTGLPQSHRDFLGRLQGLTELTTCTDAEAFKRLLHADTFDRHVVYICCHGRVNGSGTAQFVMRSAEPDMHHFQLSDVYDGIAGGPGDEAALHALCGRAHLLGSPLLYLSVCRSGDFTSPGGGSVGEALVGLGASCAVAPEVVLPKELAAFHAGEFFPAFLSGEVTAGFQLREIGRELIRRMWNPFGLIYSVKGRFDARLSYAGVRRVLPGPGRTHPAEGDLTSTEGG